MSTTLGLAHVDGRCAHGFAPIQHPTLCACAAAAARKDAGITGATDAATPDDKERIDRAIARWAATGREFSANDLRSEFAGVSGPVVGGRFNAAARRGLIRDTGRRVPSTLASTNGHEVRLWVGAAGPP